MSFQAAESGEHGLADVTAEGFLSCVDDLVLLEVGR